jgi:hypothetical protein
LSRYNRLHNLLERTAISHESTNRQDKATIDLPSRRSFLAAAALATTLGSAGRSAIAAEPASAPASPLDRKEPCPRTEPLPAIKLGK